MGFDEIKVYSLFVQSYALVSKYFENSCFRFLDDCQTLQKVNLVKSGTKIQMDIQNKPTDSKRYVPLTSNQPQHCLTNIPFSLAKTNFYLQTPLVLLELFS